MTPAELTDKLFTLINGLMETQATLANPLPIIPVVKSFQNHGRPSPPYISYDPNPIIRALGRPHKKAMTDDGIEYITEAEARVKLREIGLNGEYLHLFTTMLDFPLIRRIWDAEGIVALPPTPVVPTPRLIQGNEYEKESSMELLLRFTTSLIDSTATQMLTVEIINNIGDEDE